MKRIGIVAAAIAALVVGLAPMTASAQRANAQGGGRQAGPAPISKAARDQGMKEAPAAVTAANVSCQLSDAYHINTVTDAKTKAKTSFYEVACGQNMGYLIEQGAEQTRAFNCLAVAAQAASEVAAGRPAGVTCRLEGNADPKQGLAPYITASGRTCTVSNGRPMGATAAGENYFEAACADGHGYVIKTAAPGTNAAAQVMDCAEFLGTQTECQLTTKAQIVAAIGQLATKVGQPCTVSDARYVGTGQNGAYYEVACGAGNPGYMIQTDKAGAYSASYECSKAQAIGGGCTLTNVEVAEQAEAATYTRLANTSGYPCQVSKYAFIGVDQKTKSEVVELACANRADGGIGLFPTAAGAKGQVLDCVAAQSLGVSCKLTQPSAAYAKYTAGLAAKGKPSCKVSNAKWLASTTDGADLIETACSDGLPGFVMSITRANGNVQELLTCGQARQAGAACTFPTNTASAAAAAAAR